jgi:hypothetical protein
MKMDWFKARLNEPSTWLGFGAVYAAIVVVLQGGDWTLTIPPLLAAVIGVFKGEAASK